MPDQDLDLNQQRRNAEKYQRSVAIALLVAFVVGVVIIVLDRHQIAGILERADWRFAVYAVVTTAGVFLVESASYVVVNRVIGIRVDRLYLLLVGAISIAIGNVITVAGVAEHVLRALFLVPRGCRVGDVISASLIHSYIKDFVIWLLVPLGMVMLLLGGTLPPPVAAGTIVLGVASASLLGVVTAALFYAPLRRLLLRVFRWLWRFLGHIVPPLRRADPDADIERFDIAVDRGRKSLGKSPAALIGIVLLIAADWMFTLLTLELSFMALGVTPSLGVLTTSFALGRISGIISLVPGGIGIIGPSTAGAFALLGGVPFAVAVLAVALYRVVSNYIPYLVSFAFYRFLLRQPAKQ